MREKVFKIIRICEKVIQIAMDARKKCENSFLHLPKLDFHRFSLIFIEVLKIAENLEKQKFYVFCLFTPLYRRFRLSRVSHAQDLDEIYRLVSKILNFMPCGSVFDRCSVLLYKKVPWALKSFQNEDL